MTNRRKKGSAPQTPAETSDTVPEARPPQQAADDPAERRARCRAEIDKVLQRHRCAIMAQLADMRRVGDYGDEGNIKAVWNVLPLRIDE